MKTVLVVDDEPKIVGLARDYLEHAGFSVVSASDGPEALKRARADHPDLIVLDLGLPKLDGLDVARALRQMSSVPIVILSGRADESDKLVGLELGADDYVTKPFSPKELVARVRAVLRRSERPATPSDVIRAAEDHDEDRGEESSHVMTPCSFLVALRLDRGCGAFVNAVRRSRIRR